MGVFGKACTVDGLRCGVVARRGELYCLTFERQYATLEQLEGVNWGKPEICGETVLPAGYGFEVQNIAYQHSTRCWVVTLAVGRQHLGNVAAYVDQVAQLQAESAEKDRAIAELSAQLDEADEAAIALYEQLAAATAEQEVAEDE